MENGEWRMGKNGEWRMENGGDWRSSFQNPKYPKSTIQIT
jgi:hypothetical protein